VVGHGQRATTKYVLDRPSALGPAHGIFYIWQRGDALGRPAPLPGLHVERHTDPERLAAITSQDINLCETRLGAGHLANVASLDGQVVARGWSATLTASIGELGIVFPLPAGNRYLWDFETLPEWRGRGIYPLLLQTIAARETDAWRFWIGHDTVNTSSSRGILKAGFQPVATYHPRAGLLAPAGPPDLARAASQLLGIPMATCTPETHGERAIEGCSS
jgi:GNAT superfamily N-acetyltransferase